MAYKPFNSKQIINRAVLQELFPYIGNQTLDVLLESISSDLAVPLKVDAQNPASLTINVGPSIVANAVSNRNKSLTFVNGIIPEITSATVTFPVSSGGNITSSTGATVPLTLPIGDFVQVLLTINDLSQISAIVGTPSPVEASLVVPAPTVNLLPFAYVTLFNSGGTIQNISQDSIYQIVAAEAPSPSSASTTGWIAKNAALTAGTTEFTVNLVNPMTDLSYVVLPMMGNLTDANPQFQQIQVTSKTLTSFVFQWNYPLDTSNYFISYIVPPISASVRERAVPNGVSSVTLNLPIPSNGSNYGIVGVVQNLVNTFPQFQTALITTQGPTSFVESFNALTDVSNDSIVFITNPTAQVSVGSGVTSITITLPVAYGSTGYAVVAVLSNVVDSTPMFQTLVTTAKTSSQFTVKVNVATLTPNYTLTYYALPVTA